MVNDMADMNAIGLTVILSRPKITWQAISNTMW